MAAEAQLSHESMPHCYVWLAISCFYDMRSKCLDYNEQMIMLWWSFVLKNIKLLSLLLEFEPMRTDTECCSYRIAVVGSSLFITVRWHSSLQCSSTYVSAKIQNCTELNVMRCCVSQFHSCALFVFHFLKFFLTSFCQCLFFSEVAR